MKYKFKKYRHELSDGEVFIEYGVDRDSLSDDNKSLYHITWHGWTSQNIQSIIDKTNALMNEEVYEYQVEGSDLFILIDKSYASFFDWRTKKETEDFYLTKDEFISFMQDFKKFIEENS